VRECGAPKNLMRSSAVGAERRWDIHTSFSDHVPSMLVAADSGESRMTQSAFRRPFQKLDSRLDEWI
jgi:hypothetical protein